MIRKDAIPSTVIEIVADTFSVDPNLITRETRAEDIDGWDSLNHSILLIRLEKRLGLPISESSALHRTLGDLIDSLCKVSEGGRAAHG
jgi:acyl carrier protein